jgi:hypothetical protein
MARCRASNPMLAGFQLDPASVLVNNVGKPRPDSECGEPAYNVFGFGGSIVRDFQERDQGLTVIRRKPQSEFVTADRTRAEVETFRDVILLQAPRIEPFLNYKCSLGQPSHAESLAI